MSNSTKYIVSKLYLMPGFHHSVAVLPLLLPLHKFRKNYVRAVRITLPTWKIPLRRCRSHLPLRRNCRSVANRIESYFCRSATGGQPISVLVTSSLCRPIWKDVSSNSVLAHNGRMAAVQRQGTTAQWNCNGETATAERQRNGGKQA